MKYDIQGNWISVDDKLPNEEDKVITYSFDGFMHKTNIAFYWDDTYGEEGFYKTLRKDSKFYPTHWMPLPRSPKEK